MLSMSPTGKAPLFYFFFTAILSILCLSAVAKAAATIYTDKADFDASGWPTRFIVFNQNDGGSAITDPPHQTGLDWLGHPVICFDSVFSRDSLVHDSDQRIQYLSIRHTRELQSLTTS